VAPPDSIPYSYYVSGAGDTSPGHTGYAPSARINTLANILAACVNSAGVTTGAGDGTNCGTLFQATTPASTGVAPTDTLQAILNLAQAPGSLSGTNATNFFNLSALNPQFLYPNGLTAAPNDWTLPLAFTGGGFLNAAAGSYNPTYATGLAIDAQGNIWATSVGATKESSTSSSSGPGAIVGLANNGAPLPGENNTVAGTWGGFTTNVNRPRSGPAVDLNGNIWFANFGNSSTQTTLAAITPSGLPLPALNGGSPVSLTPIQHGYVQGLAIDASNNVWITGDVSTAGSLLEYSSAGVQNTSIGTYTFTANPAFNNVSLDHNGNVWLSTGAGDAQVQLAGTPATLTLANFYQDPTGNNYGSLAVNSSGDVFGCASAYIFEDEPPSSYAVVSTTGGCYAGSLYAPIALDGGGNLWSPVLAESPINGQSDEIGSLSEVNSSTGTILSPATYGYQGIGTAGNGGGSTGEGSTILISNGPAGTYSIAGTAVDQSGNVWVLNGYDKSVASDQLVEFVGLGAPTVQPTALALQNNTFTKLP
jgi:hypothetical protein